MMAEGVISAALQQVGLPNGLAHRRSLGGGHGASVELLQLEGGQRVVVKYATGAMACRLEEEAAGLRALAETQTIAVPHVHGVVTNHREGVLLLSHIESGSPTNSVWRRFGGELAALHRVDVGRRYGFEMDNHLGAMPQPNGWKDDWVEFNRVHRFEHQLHLAKDRHLQPSEARRVESLCDNLDQHLPRQPKPALLHGDLWSGNAMPTTDGRIAVIDPAVYIGDGWADIAMMQLFGGFPNQCIDVYRAAATDHDDVEQRIAVYQLYHVLNHVNLFGRGYVGQAMDLVSTLGY